MERKEVNVLDYIFLLYDARYFIIVNFIVVCLVASVLAYTMPEYYRSTVVLLPPTETKRTFGFTDVLSSIPVTTLRLGSKGSPSDIFMGILQSQTIKVSMVDRFNLTDVYGASDRDAAVGALGGLTKVEATREGLIEINVEDTDPVRAATMANTYIVLLDSLNQVINQRSARERADFIEQQILENDISLAQAEAELKEFQLKTNAISPYQQARIALSVASELELDIMNKENLLKEYQEKSYSRSHPVVRELLNSITFREQQLHDLRFGSSRSDREQLFVPLQNAPDLSLQYAKLSRRVDVLGTLEELLRQQYEESRIEQVNTTSTITVLDRAYPAIRKSRPKRKLIVLVAAAASIFFSILSVILIEYLNSVATSDPENRRKIERIAQILRIRKKK